MGRFEPCRIDLVVRGNDPPEGLLVSYGPWGMSELQSQRVPAEAGGEGVPLRLELLCGDVWVRAATVTSEARCRQAREDGRIRLTASRAPTVVECDLAR